MHSLSLYLSVITRANTILMIRITVFRIGPSFDNGHGTGRCCTGHCMMRFYCMFYMVLISIVGFVLFKVRVIEFELFATKNATFAF